MIDDRVVSKWSYVSHSSQTPGGYDSSKYHNKGKSAGAGNAQNTNFWGGGNSSSATSSNPIKYNHKETVRNHHQSSFCPEPKSGPEPGGQRTVVLGESPPPSNRRRSTSSERKRSRKRKSFRRDDDESSPRPPNHPGKT